MVGKLRAELISGNVLECLGHPQLDNTCPSPDVTLCHANTPEQEVEAQGLLQAGKSQLTPSQKW